MKVVYSWLKEYVQIPVEPQQIIDDLTMLGLEVGAVEHLEPAFEGVVVARVEKLDPHPGNDHLQVAQVRAGADKPPFAVVTGAHNLRADDLVPLALPGATLDGTTIGAREFDGVSSQGMVCSHLELDLAPGMGLDRSVTDDGAGIMILPNDLEPGQDLAAALDLPDLVIEIELTPNYAAHAQGYAGIAREIAARYQVPLSLPDPGPVGEWIHSSDGDVKAGDWRISIDSGEDCRRYAAAALQGATVQESPAWLRSRLVKSGFRPVNNVVDITNYILLEYSQPLHAFDAARLPAQTVGVRRASDGEELVTLDGKTRSLSQQDLVITAADQAVAVAGVMGGQDTEVEDTTTRIWLESANFAGPRVMHTGRRLGLTTDASLRFSKNIDPSLCQPALLRAVELLQQLAGARLEEQLLDAYPGQQPPTVLELDLDRCNGLLGTSLSAGQVRELLERWYFAVQAGEGNKLTVTVPSFRTDVADPVDLTEEVARAYGYNRLPSELDPGTQAAGAVPDPEKRRRRLEGFLTGQGFFEAKGYSFTSPRLVEQLTGSGGHPWVEQAVLVANPMTSEHSHLRTSLIPGLLETAAYNSRQGNQQLRLFEVGPVYWPRELPLSDLPVEEERLAILLTGEEPEKQWYGQERAADFFSLKGVLEGWLNGSEQEQEIDWVPVTDLDKGTRDRLAPSSSSPGLEPALFHPGRSALLLADGSPAGIAGEIHPLIQQDFGLESRVVVFDGFLSRLTGLRPLVPSYQPLQRFPVVRRDLAFVVDRSVPAARAAHVLREAGGELVRDVRLFDVYRGEHIEPGRKSLAFAITYQAADRTLTDEEVEAAHNQLRAAAESELGAGLRS